MINCHPVTMLKESIILLRHFLRFIAPSCRLLQTQSMQGPAKCPRRSVRVGWMQSKWNQLPQTEHSITSLHRFHCFTSRRCVFTAVHHHCLGNSFHLLWGTWTWIGKLAQRVVLEWLGDVCVVHRNEPALSHPYFCSEIISHEGDSSATCKFQRHCLCCVRKSKSWDTTPVCSLQMLPAIPALLVCGRTDDVVHPGRCWAGPAAALWQRHHLSDVETTWRQPVLSLSQCAFLENLLEFVFAKAEAEMQYNFMKTNPNCHPATEVLLWCQ